MANSLKEIIEGITRIVEENLPEITKVKYSGVMNTDLPRDFPTLYLFCEDPSTLNENHNLITLQMYFADVQISQNEEWKKDYEIKSDMMQTASKLFDLLENEGWLDTVAIPLQPFTSDMNDGLSGVQCSVPFTVEKPCIIEDYEPGTPTPEPVTVTITSPITGEEFEEGTDITVIYSLSTEEGVTDVALEIDGVETQRKTVIFDAFLISGLDVNSHSIVLKAYNSLELVATSNTVTVTVVEVPIFEAETTALMTALAIPNDENPSDYTGLTNAQIWTIVNNRFLGYKANGLMSLIHSEWWMLGSSSVQHSYNAMNPATFQLTWFGGWVHDKNGAFGNKTNTYASAGFIPSVEQDVNSNGITITSGASNGLIGLQVQMGAFQTLTQASTLILSSGGMAISRMNGEVIQGGNIDVIGTYHSVRQNSILSKIFKNGLSIASGNSGGSLPNREIYIGAFKNDGVATNFSDQRIQNAGCTAGLSDVQALAHQTLVDEFENALSRKTW